METRIGDLSDFIKAVVCGELSPEQVKDMIFKKKLTDAVVPKVMEALNSCNSRMNLTGEMRDYALITLSVQITSDIIEGLMSDDDEEEDEDEPTPSEPPKCDCGHCHSDKEPPATDELFEAVNALKSILGK